MSEKIKGYTFRQGDQYPISRDGKINWRPDRDDVIRDAKMVKATHLIAVGEDGTIISEEPLQNMEARADKPTCDCCGIVNDLYVCSHAINATHCGYEGTCRHQQQPNPELITPNS